MKLLVQLFEARHLKNSDRPWQAYAQLKLGHSKRKSSISPSGAQDPYWYEDFTFHVDDAEALLNIAIWGQDRLSHVFLGRIRLAVGDILKAENHSLPSSWHPLEKRHSKSRSSVTGEVRLSCSLSLGENSLPRHLSGQRLSDAGSESFASEHSTQSNGLNYDSNAAHEGHKVLKQSVLSIFTQFVYTLMACFASILSLIFPKVLMAWLSSRVPWLVSIAKENESNAGENLEVAREDSFMEDEDVIFPAFFDDDGIFNPSSLREMPPPLKDMLLSETYMISAKTMNGLIFGPGSQFQQDLAAALKMTNLVEGSWTRGENDLPRRIVTYLKAATKLVPSVKCTEEQVYSRADDQGFIVDVLASTPDVPSGSTFKVHIQYCIFSGSCTTSGEKTCFLRISWGIKFLTSSLIKGFIEKGARQGLQESYKQFVHVLGKYAMLPEGSSTTEAKLQEGSSITETKSVEDAVGSSISCSGWQLMKGCLQVCLTLALIIIIFAHMYSLKSYDESRFEIWRIDLPDSLFEFILPVLLGVQIPSILGQAKTLLYGRQ